MTSTATPFANVLIPHDNDFHPEFGSDLYPKGFVIALPKREGYFGAEEFYGRFDVAMGAKSSGLDVIATKPRSLKSATHPPTKPTMVKPTGELWMKDSTR